MNRIRKKPEINYDATPEPQADTTFDIRRGLIALVGLFAFMILMSLICAWLR